MDVKQVKNIMRKYGKAWETRDSGLLLECFTKSGKYQQSPHAKPFRGHREIKKFWDDVVGKDTENIKFKLYRCYVSSDGKTGFAEWECINDHKWKHDGKWRKGHMAGIMVLKMKNKKISHLNEYWNTKELKN
jgi:ketosteroid isomerase-like protein